MRIVVVGTGYVGLVSGLCFAEFGFNVTCVDVDQDKIQKLQRGSVPIYEQGLDVLLQKNLESKNICFTTNLIDNIQDVDLICIAVNTPSTDCGTVDLSYILKAVSDIAPHLQKHTPVVIKSTVPPGTCRALKEHILSINNESRFDIISNPEFLREGSALRDFIQPGGGR